MTRFLLALVAALGAAAPAPADLIVTVGSVALSPGQATATLPVYVQSDVGTTNLQAFSLGLQISPATPGSTGQVSFVTPLTDAQYANPNYVFFGTSATAPGPSGAVFQTVYPDDTYVGGDGHAVFPNTVPVGTTQELLLLIDVTRLTGSPPGNELFTVSVLTTGPNQSQFLGANGDLIPFTSVPGVVTAAAAPVPEPASLAALAGAIGIGVATLRRRRTT